MLRLAPLLFLVACSSKPDAPAPTPATATAPTPATAPAPTAQPAPAPTPAPTPTPAPELVWPTPMKGLPQTYAELRALLPPGFELVWLPTWKAEHGRTKEELVTQVFGEVVRHDFDGNGKPDLMFVMEAPFAPDGDSGEPGERTLVAFMQGADGQLTRTLEVHDLVYGALSPDIDSFGGLKLEGERVTFEQSFGMGREANSTHHEIAYRDGDFYFVGYGQEFNDDIPGSPDHSPSSFMLDLVAGTGKETDGPRDIEDRPLKFTPKPLVKVRDFTPETKLEDVLPTAEPVRAWTVIGDLIELGQGAAPGKVRVIDAKGEHCVSDVGPAVERATKSISPGLAAADVTVAPLLNAACRGWLALPTTTEVTLFRPQLSSSTLSGMADAAARADRTWQLAQRHFERTAFDDVGQKVLRNLNALTAPDGRRLVVVNDTLRASAPEAHASVVVEVKGNPAVFTRVAGIYHTVASWALGIGDQLYFAETTYCGPDTGERVVRVYTSDESYPPLSDEAAELSDRRLTVIAESKLRCAE